MSSRGPENQPKPSPFEVEHKLVPLGNDFEARALRAEAIASVLLPSIAKLSEEVRPSTYKINKLNRTAQEILDMYRAADTIKERQEWDNGYPYTEAYE